jgi:hypothetical protein
LKTKFFLAANKIAMEDKLFDAHKTNRTILKKKLQNKLHENKDTHEKAQNETKKPEDDKLAYLVANDEVGVDGGAGPAHDRDEHGKGGVDQIHVQNQRDLFKQKIIKHGKGGVDQIHVQNQRDLFKQK